MAVISKDKHGAHLFSFSKKDKKCFLYLCDFERSVSIRGPAEIFRLEYVAGTNINRIDVSNNGHIWLSPKNDKKGSAVLKILIRSIRVPVNSSSFHEKAGLETINHPAAEPRGIKFKKYLGKDSYVDVSSPAVQRVSLEILSTLSERERENTYMKACAIFRWIKQNISYCIVKKEIVNAVASWIPHLPEEKRRDASSILCQSLKYRRDYLQNIGRRIHIPSHITEPFEVAKYILTEFNSMWGILQFGWIGEGSASQTINDGMGKCVGIANTFVALCRSVGIPAETVSGNVKTSTGDGGGHQWAAIYLAPYGWLEVDPTRGRYLEDFPCDYYQYEFLPSRFEGEVNITSRKLG